MGLVVLGGAWLVLALRDDLWEIWGVPGWVSQGVLIAIVLVAAFHYGHMRQALRAMPAEARWVVIGILLLALAGQLNRNKSDAFPFVAWQMYGSYPPAEVTIHRYEATTASGAVEPFAPPHALMTFSEHQINDRLTQQIARAGGPQQGEAWEEHEQTLRALMTLANRNRDDAIVSLSVFRDRAMSWPYEGKDNIRWERCGSVSHEAEAQAGKGAGDG